MLKVMRRLWLPLLVLLMVVIGGFVITRMHGIFGSDTEITREGSGINNDAKPFNPKQVTYEVFGPSGSLATILWLTALKREGLKVSAWAFLELGMLVMPPTLLLAIGGLFIF